MSERTLLDDLADAEARVAELQRRIAGASCDQVGHAWKHIGGRNASCSRGGDCMCSIPVHECSKCGDCDYGDNEEAAETILGCEADYADERIGLVSTPQTTIEQSKPDP